MARNNVTGQIVVHGPAPLVSHHVEGVVRVRLNSWVTHDGDVDGRVEGLDTPGRHRRLLQVVGSSPLLRAVSEEQDSLA